MELILDHLGVAAAGAREDSSLPARRLLARVGSTGVATVIGAGVTTSASWAALANGTAAHAIEMDDCTRASSLHPGVVVIPAAIAVAEEVGASPIAMLEAVVAGYEITMRVGAALDPASAYRRGFHPTGVAGVFGATIAAGRLFGLDATQLTHALGIAGTMASGSLEYLSDGAWTKRLNPGWAGHAGIVAALLAAGGFTGPASVLEGRLGLLRAYSDNGSPAGLVAELGGVPKIMEVAIKPYGCCRYVHGSVDAMLELRTREAFRPEDVTRIELGILSVGYLLVAEPIERKQSPQSQVEAQFSAPFAAAVTLVHGRAGTREFSGANLADERIIRLMSVTTCHRDTALDDAYPASLPATARVWLRDGRCMETRVDFPLGEPERPLSSSQLSARFIELGGRLIGEDVAAALAPRFLALDAEEVLGPLLAPFKAEHVDRTTATPL